MFLLDRPEGDPAVVTSASDLTLASTCEFAFLRTLDAKLGRLAALDVERDAMEARAAALGDVHEERVLDAYRADPALRVVEIARPSPLTRESLLAAAEETRAAFAEGADVVFQATFFDETRPSRPFVGFADFIVRRPPVGEMPERYRVQDTKLARRAKVTALMQLAAYAEQLARIGVEVDDTVDLILGDGSVSEHRLADITPVFLNRRERLARIVGEHLAEEAPVAWGDPRYAIDGRCEHCDAELQSHRDLLMVAGMRLTQRERLLAAGIATIDQLGALERRPDSVDIPDATYRALHSQAALQLLADRPVVEAESGDQADAAGGGAAIPPVDFHTPSTIATLPLPDPGDIFFDFEGDPLYSEGAPGPGRRASWGLDYLFGLVDDSESFTAFWAHDLAEEKRALEEFLDWVVARRARHPGMHIYHYASYERTHLLSLAARHGTGERIVDELLRDSVLVDLYPVVKKALRLGTRSYSIKKLEPLYMGGENRDQMAVAAGADSVAEYARAHELREAGDHAAAQTILDEIGDYNRYDCVSTLRLRDWLLAKAAEHGVAPGTVVRPELDDSGARIADAEPSTLNLELLALAGGSGSVGRGGHTGASADRTSDEQAYALAAAAIDYHRRENKSFWWEHFARLVDPIELWEGTRDVFRVSGAVLEREWHREGRQRSDRRHLLLRGAWAPGSSVPRETFALYEHPAPFLSGSTAPGARAYGRARVLDVFDDGTVLIEEICPGGAETWHELPVALTPGPPPQPGSQAAAIEEWGRRVADAAPDWPRDAVADILRRLPPRTHSGGGLEPLRHADDSVRAVTRSLLDLDSSYLAVQGPPGTGKTYLASHVIAELVSIHRWRIGVVAQSHAVVENVLGRVVSAGLDPALVAKTARSGAEPGDYDDAGFTLLESNGHAGFAARNAETGFVLGGTAWDFSNPSRFERASLDLLVVDEAGQFSLAYTVAASVAARSLLLLGDPQQLPQVSQGIHPEPVDTSALGFVTEGHDVLPPELGYFLAESRRMDAAVTLPISRLSYEGQLHAHACTRARHLDGVVAGLTPVPVAHGGNSTSSAEEAEAVLALVQRHLGARWTDPDSGRVDSPLHEGDIIVVTPYNAQRELVRARLDEAGLPGVRVGTVDKFQGQEAVISIVTLAASSAVDVPRGLSFLLMKNRLNVAISRAQWAAFLVFSPELVEHLPHTPDGVRELSAFIELTRPTG